MSSNDFPIMNYLKIFFRRKELLIIPTILGLAAGVCASVIMPKQYRSESVIMVEEGKSDNPLFGGIAVSSTMKQRLATLSESMLGWNSLKELVERLNMAREVRTTKGFEDLILGIRKRINIRARGRNIIYLSFVDKDPIMTQKVVETITDIFIERNKKLQDEETADAIKFIEEQLHVYKGKIMSAEIARLQDQLDELLVDSTEKHPLVRQFRERIDLKRKELHEANLEYTEPDRLAMESSSPLIESIQSALDNLEGRAVQASRPGTNPAQPAQAAEKSTVQLMLVDNLENVMARDGAVNEKIYNTLLSRLETAKITQRLQASKEGTKYTVLDPPRIPLEPFKPDKMMVSLAGMFGGLLLGFGIIFGLEFLDKSFLDVEEAKDFFGVPLLGAISKIQTQASLRKERERLIWAYFLTVVVSAMAVAITFAVKGII